MSISKEKIRRKIIKEFLLDEDPELELVELHIKHQKNRTAYVEFSIRLKTTKEIYTFWAIIEKEEDGLILSFWHPLEQGGSHAEQNKIPSLP